jgi:GNAT superfamily N-acetyltransferase
VSDIFSRGDCGIRQAERADLQNIIQLFNRSIKELCCNDYPAEIIAVWGNLKRSEIFKEAIYQKRLIVAETEDKLMGFVNAVPGEILNLFISPDYSGQGIGKALFDIGFKMAKHGYDGNIKLEATLTAETFCQHLGFVSKERSYSSHSSCDMKIEIIKMELDQG